MSRPRAGGGGLVYSSAPGCVHSQPCNEESAMNEGRCPQCGEPASGKFCSSCGSSLLRSACPGCRAPLNSGARFCHVCGKPMGKRLRGAAKPAGTHPGWIAAAALMAVIALVWAARVGRDSNTSPPPATALPAAAPAPDISGMTPRERANAVFDRIMAAAERGDSTEIEFFRPMALGAYALLDSSDSDTRYDVGMIHLITGDVAGARAQAAVYARTGRTRRVERAAGLPRFPRPLRSRNRNRRNGLCGSPSGNRRVLGRSAPRTGQKRLACQTFT